MKQTCEICGRELGFFERSHRCENNKLGIGYEVLCSNCNNNVNLAISQINDICSHVLDELHTKLSAYPYASNNINILIFLSVKEIFKTFPDFADRDNLIISTFYPENNTVLLTFDYLIEITYKVLRNSFMAVLGRYGLDTFESFSGYMGRECLYLQQIQANCGENGDFVYTDLFLCPSGMVFFDQENDIVRSLFVSEDRTLKFSESEDDVTYDLNITKQRYNNLKKRPILKFNRRDQRSQVAKKITEYNDEKSERIESELSALINNLNVSIERDLRELHPDLQLSDIPLDSVLVCSIKTLFEQDINQDYVREAPDGLLSLIVETAYPENLERSGLVDASEIQDYLNDVCLFVTDFISSFGSTNNLRSFAFLTPRSYLISQLGPNEVFLNARENLPSDLYCGYQHMIYQGRDEFFIPISTTQKNADGYYFLDGIRLHSKRKEPLEELESFFSENALDYYRNQYEKELAGMTTLKDKEMSDIARRIFIGYGYLPFTIYDEWANIERNIRASDILMQELIPEREKKSASKGRNNIFYAGRTVNAFEQQAANLAQDFDIKELPVARGLLWKKLKSEICDACAEEFIRLTGDFLTEEDNLETAILKYSALSSIEPEKAYFLGLFIYYLMKKGILEDTDFLDHYDSIAKTYLKMNPSTEKIVEFSELSEPEKKPFDMDTDELKAFNEEIEREKKKPLESGLFFSDRSIDGDRDSTDDLVHILNKSAPEQGGELELLSDLVEQMELPSQEVTMVEQADDLKTENESMAAEINQVSDQEIEEVGAKSGPSFFKTIVKRFVGD